MTAMKVLSARHSGAWSGQGWEQLIGGEERRGADALINAGAADVRIVVAGIIDFTAFGGIVENPITAADDSLIAAKGTIGEADTRSERCQRGTARMIAAAIAVIALITRHTVG